MTRWITLFILVFTIYLSFIERVNIPSRSISSTSSKVWPLHLKFPRDSKFYTISNNQKISGPSHKINYDESYLKKVFYILIKNAHKLAKDNLFKVKSSRRAYNSFLLASLIVPYHEGKLIHIRKRKFKLCSKNANSFRSLHKNIGRLGRKKVLTPAGKRRYNNLVSIKNTLINSFTEEKIIQNCQEYGYSNNTQVNQLLGSENNEDFGMMQINAYAHTRLFETLKILDIDYVVNYGLDHLFDGFIKLYHDFDSDDDYKCLADRDIDINTIDYKYLIQASWGSKYNAGNLHTRNVCRFQRSIKCLKKAEGVVNLKSRLNASYSNWLLKQGSHFEIREKYLGVLEDLDVLLGGKDIKFKRSECRWMQNDLDFYLAMKKFLISKEDFFHQHLKPGSIELKVLDQLISNLDRDELRFNYLLSYVEGKVINEPKKNKEVKSNDNKIKASLINLKVEQVKPVFMKTTASVNLRDGPSPKDKKVDILRKGTQVKFLEKRQIREKVLWYKVEIDKSKIGWIYSKYLKSIK